MKKIFVLLSILLFCTNVNADKMTKNGFLSKNVNYSKDPFGGLLSDWVEEVAGVERIVISEDNKVNGKSCNVWGKSIENYHDMDRATCFKEFNPKILDFIASKIN
tara:strand:- start:73 stop:387 length:315 start_codon:yes stop_codon:yes gene_type:complete